MDLIRDLEIIIPTYNRSKTLEKTLKSLLSSPVGQCQISILDNNSTDETAQVIEGFSATRTNMIYIKSRYNIGQSGNIWKSLTLPTKKYFWIVFDDAGLDFTHWKDIEAGLDSNAHCILTTNYCKVKDTSERAPILLMLIYMFSGIFRADLITENIILYALTDIYTAHPQMALLAALFDDNREIYLPENTIAFPRSNPEPKEDYTFHRAGDDFFHFRISQPAHFMHGLLNAMESLKDKKLKSQCIELLFTRHNGHGPYINLLRTNWFAYNKRNSFDIFCALSLKVVVIHIFTYFKIRAKRIYQKLI
jgi:glycosyltransferase involved in cell wall biosynthesis